MQYKCRGVEWMVSEDGDENGDEISLTMEVDYWKSVVDPVLNYSFQTTSLDSLYTR